MYKFEYEEVWGCEVLKKTDFPAYEWCKNIAQKEIAFKKTEVQYRLDQVAELVTESDNERLKEKIKFYSDNDPFFSENRNNLEVLDEKISGYCETNRNTIQNFKRNLSKKFVFMKAENEKYVWDSINMLNTNYSALAYIITKFREQLKLYNESFSNIYRTVFQGSFESMERAELSLFQKLIYNYLVENLKEMDSEIIKDILFTIQKTYEIGEISEKQAYDILEKRVGPDKVLKFSGNFSFADKLGVDYLVYHKGIEQWVPVQVKSNFKSCYENKKFCTGVCMGKEKGKWKYMKHGLNVKRKDIED